MRILLLALVLSLVSCTEKNDEYYLTHPEVLRKAVLNCQHKTETEACKNFYRLATLHDQLALQLQRDPQQFGQSIIALENQIAALQQQDNPKDKEKLVALEREKKDRLFIVRLFESPSK